MPQAAYSMPVFEVVQGMECPDGVAYAFDKVVLEQYRSSICQAIDPRAGRCGGVEIVKVTPELAHQVYRTGGLYVTSIDRHSGDLGPLKPAA